MSTATCTTVRLDGVGRVPATPASEVERGGLLLWNGGLITVVEFTAPRGSNVQIIERNSLTGATYDRTTPAHRPLAYFGAVEKLAAVTTGRPLGGVTDVDSRELTSYLGHEISTPDGWHVLADLVVADVMVYATIAGRAHQAELYPGQLVGVREGVEPVEKCGCLEEVFFLTGHYPPCPNAVGWPVDA